jgi:two-component system alkaline phosphatase synthesis response regulator PhoP
MTILIADDDPITLDSLAEGLKLEGFRTVLARDGEEALEAWKVHRPDLLCLDIMMPRLDGYEVCRQVRAMDALVPILFLSAKSEEIDVVVGLKLGADDFIRKPFGKHELLARIHGTLRRSAAVVRGREAVWFEMGGLRVYPRELKAMKGNEEVVLTPREVSLLEVLHEHAGEVVTRDVLLDRCWGIDYFPESRTLDQHIAKLRKKVEGNLSCAVLIETVRGMGYRWRGGKMVWRDGFACKLPAE